MTDKFENILNRQLRSFSRKQIHYLRTASIIPLGQGSKYKFGYKNLKINAEVIFNWSGANFLYVKFESSLVFAMMRHMNLTILYLKSTKSQRNFIHQAKTAQSPFKNWKILTKNELKKTANKKDVIMMKFVSFS